MIKEVVEKDAEIERLKVDSKSLRVSLYNALDIDEGSEWPVIVGAAAVTRSAAK